MTLLDTLLVRLTGDSSGYLKSLNQAKAATQSATKVIQHSAIQIGGFAGALVGFMGSVQMAKGLLNITKSFGDFDKSMTESLSVMGEVSESMRLEMEETAKTISTKSINSADKLAKSYFFLASAGLNAAQSVSLLSGVERFSIAGAFDLEKATELLTDTMGALEMKSKDSTEILVNATKISDLLVRGNQLAQVSTEQLAESMSKAAAAVKTYNIPLEEATAATMMFGEKAALKGVAAGNAFVRMVQLLTHSAVKFGDTPLGKKIAIFDPDTGKLSDMAGIFERMNKELGSMPDKQRAAAFASLGFETRIQKLILPLMRSSDLMREWTEELKKAGGVTERVAEKQLKAFNNQAQLLLNQFNVLKIEIGKTLVPVFERINAALSKTIAWFRSLEEDTKLLVVIISGVSAAIMVIVPILYLLGPLFTAAFAPIMMIGGGLLHLLHLNVILGGLWAILKVVGIVLWTVINPLKLLVFTFMALKASVMFFFGAEMTLIFTILKIVAVLAVLIHRAGGVKEAFQIMENALISLWKWTAPIRKALGSLFEAGWEKISHAVLEMGDHLIDMVMEFVHWLGIDWDSLWEGLRSAAVDAIIAIEYSLDKIPYLAEFAFTAAKYHALVFINVLGHFFGTQLPYMLSYFVRQVPAALMMVFDWIVESIYTLIGNVGIAMKAGGAGISWSSLLIGYWKANTKMFLGIVGLWASLPARLAEVAGKGAAAVGNAVKDISKKFMRNLMIEEQIQQQNVQNLFKKRLGMPTIPSRKFEKFVLPQRVPTELERQWREEFEKMGNAIGQSFAAFRAMKLEEWAKEHMTDVGKAFSAVAEEAGKAGKGTGENFVGQFAKAMKKIDAVLVGTAEDFEKLEEYQLALAGKTDQYGLPDGLGVDPGDVAPDNGGAPGADNAWQKMLDVLKDIKDNTADDGNDLAVDLHGV